MAGRDCFDPECGAMISLSREEYERVRAKPTTFAVKSEHVDDVVEYVIARLDDHWITEKGTPDGQRVATELDPRS